jgi:hypothetical protein
MSLSLCVYFVHIVLRSNGTGIQLFLILAMTVVVLDLCIGNSFLFVKLNLTLLHSKLSKTWLFLY